MAKDQATEGFGDEHMPTNQLAQIHNQYLALVESPEVVDPKAAALQIVNRILSADSMEALEQIVSKGTVDAGDLVGKGFFIQSVAWFKAADKYKENSAGVFAVLTVKMEDTGESLVVTNGGENVIAILYKMHQLNGFPTSKPWSFYTAETASGFTTYWLRPFVQ